MKIYQDIIFLTGDDAQEPLALLEDSADLAINYLLQWDYGDGPERYQPPWGLDDDIERRGDLILTSNRHADYISLTREMEE